MKNYIPTPLWKKKNINNIFFAYFIFLPIRPFLAKTEVHYTSNLIFFLHLYNLDTMLIFLCLEEEDYTVTISTELNGRTVTQTVEKFPMGQPE